MAKYVHGYTERESVRLEDQAKTLNNLLHHDSLWKEGSFVLEAGCGIGSQTKVITRQNPDCNFLSIDISEDSLVQAKAMANSFALKNVDFQKANILQLPFNDETFDHVFVCFVLEHMPDYNLALAELKRVLKTNGTIMLIEGDHGSTHFHPDSMEAKKAIQCLVDLQSRHGGDANIGRKLYPILDKAGFRKIQISPRFVYADDSLPEMVEGFTKNTFAAMIEGVRQDVIDYGMMDIADFDEGVADLYSCAEKGGVFCYAFFKGFAIK